jgi:hypothetical protein
MTDLEKRRIEAQAKIVMHWVNKVRIACNI